MSESWKTKKAVLITTGGGHFRQRGNRADILSGQSLLLLLLMYLLLSGCARQLTPFSKARKADTIEAYEEFIRTNPQDPRVRYARHRIEVLRLLEAHRSGDASMAAPKENAYRTSAAPAPPTNLRQGPWNLNGAYPRSSTFTLDLYHGSSPQGVHRTTPVPHKLIIDQQGQTVTYTLQHGSLPNGYYLTAGVPFTSFRRLWESVVARDIGSYRPSYGSMSSTGDYRGNLIIEVDTGTERLARVIRLEGLNFKDENLRNLLKSMAAMHPQDHSMSFLW